LHLLFIYHCYYSVGHFMFCCYVIIAGAMDCFARGLRNAVRIIEDGVFDRHIKVCSLISSTIVKHNLSKMIMNEYDNNSNKPFTVLTLLIFNSVLGLWFCISYWQTVSSKMLSSQCHHRSVLITAVMHSELHWLCIVFKLGVTIHQLPHWLLLLDIKHCQSSAAPICQLISGDYAMTWHRRSTFGCWMFSVASQQPGTTCPIIS